MRQTLEILYDKQTEIFKHLIDLTLETFMS